MRGVRSSAESVKRKQRRNAKAQLERKQEGKSSRKTERKVTCATVGKGTHPQGLQRALFQTKEPPQSSSTSLLAQFNYKMKKYKTIPGGERNFSMRLAINLSPIWS